MPLPDHGNQGVRRRGSDLFGVVGNTGQQRSGGLLVEKVTGMPIIWLNKRRRMPITTLPDTQATQ